MYYTYSSDIPHNTQGNTRLLIYELPSPLFSTKGRPQTPCDAPMETPRRGLFQRPRYRWVCLVSARRRLCYLFSCVLLYHTILVRTIRLALNAPWYIMAGSGYIGNRFCDGCHCCLIGRDCCCCFSTARFFFSEER